MGVALAAGGELCRADEATRQKVERLMPQLMSNDATVRQSAERELFALGAAGRAELERIASDEATQRVGTALRLLGSREWSDRGPTWLAPPLIAPISTPIVPFVPPVSPQMRDALDDLQRRMDEFDRTWGIEPFAFDWPDGSSVRAKASGELMEGDRRLTWSIDESGAVKVTTKDAKDAAERTFDAKSLAELRREHPDVAKRLESVMPRSARRLAMERAASANGAKGFDAPGGAFEPQPALGIEWTPLPAVLGEQIDLKQGMVVEKVLDATLAERLGLRRHDVLLELNGKTVNGSADVRAALDTAKAGDKVTAVVLRENKRKTLDATK